MKSHLRDQLIGLGLLAVLSMSVALSYICLSALRACVGAFYPLAALAVFVVAYGFFSVVYLKILNAIVPLEEGAYDMDHDQFILWKHQTVIAHLGREALKHVVPMFLRNVYFKLLGTKMGSNVVVAEGATILDPFLTEIGANAIIGQNAVLTAHAMVPGSFFLRPVIVHEGATVGINSVLMPGVEVGAGSIVAPGSIVTMGTAIPENEFWGGIPAKRISRETVPVPGHALPGHAGVPLRQPSCYEICRSSHLVLSDPSGTVVSPSDAALSDAGSDMLTLPAENDKGHVIDKELLGGHLDHALSSEQDQALAGLIKKDRDIGTRRRAFLATGRWK